MLRQRPLLLRVVSRARFPGIYWEAESSIGEIDLGLQRETAHITSETGHSGGEKGLLMNVGFHEAKLRVNGFLVGLTDQSLPLSVAGGVLAIPKEA